MERAIGAGAVERRRPDRNHDVGAELLRLGEGAAGQRLPGNSGGETEIILDARAGAGLSAEGAGIQHHHRETFRRRIDRGRKTRRAAADDRGIVDLIPGRTADHAERAGEFGFFRIAIHGAIGDHHQRPIGRRWRIACDQLGGIMIPFRVEQMMRNAVAGEKSLQADDAARIQGPDQHRAADPALDQADPAQDQRAHDALAEIGFGDQQRAQSLRRNQERLDITLGMAVDQSDAAGELADLGEKLPRALIDHRRDVTEAIALGDRHMAGQDDEHAGPGLAGLEQHFAVLVPARLAKPAHARNLLQRQRRECLLKAGKHGSGAAIRPTSSRGIRSHFFSHDSNK